MKLVTVDNAPTFVIAGAGRAGSTAVIESLRMHPDVFITQPKEPHFLALGGRPAAFSGPGDDTHINQLAITNKADYLALFSGSEKCAARGEGSVSTLHYPAESIPAISALNPDMRIVILLREPVARAYSSFQYLRVRGFEPKSDFLSAVADEPRRRAAGWHHLWHYTGMSQYAEAVDQFQKAFPDKVGVWFHDDLTANPSGTIESIQRFIGVDPAVSAGETVQRVNVSGQPRIPVLQAAIQWSGRSEVMRKTIKRMVPFGLRERIRNANLQPNTVTAEERAALVPVFEKDLIRLQEVLGRTVPTTWAS